VETSPGCRLAHGGRLNEPESRFHATMVTNVFDLVELLPHLNVNNDADLNRFADQIRQRLCNFSAQDLKKHDLLRVAAATDAAEIVAEIDSVLRDREAGALEKPPMLQPSMTSWLVCLHTWRCQRRHETRDTSIHSHPEGADYFIA